ncbi:hypothetical protein EDD15DRAFT_713026 [Pisolithus albus]|nr:hypothetical protein EDD15DRAFT_713026 [Pisolithus albus]
MHPCLMVDEILRVVFRYIEDRMTWCALARTCRTFNEPASDLIWETLVYLPLITRNLSCERISCEGKHPPLNDNDWDVVRRISSHVRRLHLYPFPIDDDVHPWFSILTSPPDPNFLFANLRLLSFESRYAEDTEVASQIVTHLIPLLLRPRLFALRFNIPGKIYTYLNFPSIPMLCPNIRVLSIADREIKWNENSIPDEAVYLLSRVVSELGDLEMFRSNITSWDLLSSLAHARALRQLWTYLPRWLGPRTERPSGSIFPQLRTLNIRATSLASCTGFLRWTPLTKVTEISVRCSASTDDDDVSRALVEMSSLISSQCTALEFVFFFMDSFPYKAVPSSCPRPMLDPYQACHRLRVIALETPYNLTLADNDLEDLVKAWPHLEVFHLLHDGREDPLVRLTLRGITSLLYHCPKLTHFTLLFDATCVPEDTTLLSHGTLPAVKYMGVDRSPISTSSDVAAYFSNIMPYLEMISVHYL